MDGSPPGASVRGISQAWILEWVTIFYSRGASRPRGWICISWVSCIGRWVLYHWATSRTPIIAHNIPNLGGHVDIQVQEAQSTQATPSQRLVQDHYNQDVRRKCPEKVIYHIQGNPHRIISRFLWRSELALCIRWPKYWSFSFSISSSNEYSAWISFRIDWFDFLAVQGTLKSLHHILWCKHQILI